MTEREKEQSLLEELDARQDELLEALDELNLRIERLLEEWVAPKPQMA